MTRRGVGGLTVEGVDALLGVPGQHRQHHHLTQELLICNAMSRSVALARLGAVAQAQWGLVTSRQARSAGVGAVEITRLVQDDALERVAFGVYRVAGAPSVRLLELRAAWLQLEPAVEAELRDPASGVVSHASAALVYEVGDLEPGRWEFTLPVRRRTRRTDVVLHLAPVADDAVAWVDQLAVTRPPRLVADLLAARHDGDHVARVIVDLLDRGLAGHGELAVAAAPYAAAYGAPRLGAKDFLADLAARVAPTAADMGDRRG